MSLTFGDLHMAKNTATRLDFLPKQSVAELRAMWTQAFGRPLSFRVQKDLLVRLLACRLQENAHGSLRAATVRRLNQLVEEFQRTDRTPASVGAPCFKPGTRLIREWAGKTHEVTVMDQGFAYRGDRYTSLSEIAREITGARWSGPRFFGLKKTALNIDSEASHGR